MTDRFSKELLLTTSRNSSEEKQQQKSVYTMPENKRRMIFSQGFANRSNSMEFEDGTAKSQFKYSVAFVNDSLMTGDSIQRSARVSQNIKIASQEF